MFILLLKEILRFVFSNAPLTFVTLSLPHSLFGFLLHFQIEPNGVIEHDWHGNMKVRRDLRRAFRGKLILQPHFR